MKLKFLGAARQVTGSSYLVDAGESKILIDCGLYQERDYLNRNWQAFPVPPQQIQALLLTHVHLDHSGLIPKIVKEGFAGDILLTPASKELFPIVLLDSAKTQEEDAAFKKKRHQEENREVSRPETPLYTVQDVEKCLPLLKAIPYGEPVQLDERISFSFHDAGHILGSAMIEVTLKEEGDRKTIVFSGDIGKWNKPILRDPSVFDRADYVVMESTYGDRNHDTPQEAVDRLSKIVNDTFNAGGNLVIPTFAIERAQELVYHFSQLASDRKIPNVQVFLDSPMAVEITKVFERCVKYLDQETQAMFKEGRSPFEFPGLNLVETVEASKAINLIKGSIAVMAGSGMMTGGRIKHHLVRNITRSDSTLLFVGYQAVGTLGRQILDGLSPVRVLGQLYPVRMKVQKIDGFSAHADMNDLERWISSFKSPPKRVFLTHCEETSILSLENYLRSKAGWTVNSPAYLEEYTL